MKTNNMTPGSKAAKVLTIAIVIATLGFSACKKGNDSSTSTVTEQEAAQATSDAVSPSTGGFVTQVNSSVNIYSGGRYTCGVEKDSTITIVSATGANPSYNFSLMWNYTYNCTTEILTYNFTGSSSYNGPLMSEKGNSTGGFVFGVATGSPDYTLSTTYSRVGSSTSKIGRQNTFSSNVNIVSSNLLVDKTTDKIASGTATVNITGSSSSGRSFSFNGHITFLGNQKATVVLNSGASYSIAW